MITSKQKKMAALKKVVKGFKPHKMDESKKHESAKGDKREDMSEMDGKGGPGKKC